MQLYEGVDVSFKQTPVTDNFHISRPEEQQESGIKRHLTGCCFAHNSPTAHTVGYYISNGIKMPLPSFYFSLKATGAVIRSLTGVSP
jgi:hypothetical protein